MLFPEKHIKRGTFKLHSGKISEILYDVNSLLTDKEYIELITEKIPPSKHYIGIVTGGALIALLLAQKNNSKFSMIKDNELKGDFPEGEWILIDDVATTEMSLKDALKITKSKPKEIFVVVDRREDKDINLKINSIFKMKA